MKYEVWLGVKRKNFSFQYGNFWDSGTKSLKSCLIVTSIYVFCYTTCKRVENTLDTSKYFAATPAIMI